MSTVDLVKAIDAGDISLLDEILKKNPELLEDTYFSWKHGDGSGAKGYALNCATSFNQPAIIKFLVKEKGADVNLQKTEDQMWTSLHFAKNRACHEAAAMLLLLEADPTLKKADGEDTVDFCRSYEVKKQLGESNLELLRQKKISGIWTRGAGQEVAHDHEQPGAKLRLTDIFNFETRMLRSIVRDIDNKTIGQTIVFFDDMRDTTIVHRALKEFKKLGGEADEDLIDSRPLRGKIRQP